MWSGDPQYSQWALNPSTYQNVSHEEVDWAALAQQWIQMKETHPPEQIPVAPPPPSITGKTDSVEKKKESELEGGEAPMDMDTKEEPDNSNSSNTQDANSWNTWPNWQQWGWNWGATGGMVPPGGVPPPNQQPLASGKTTTPSGTIGVPPYSYPQNSQPFTSGTGVYDYNHATGSEQYNQVMAGNYWTAGSPADAGGIPPGAATGPSPFIRQNRHDWRRNSRSHDRIKTTEKSDDEEDTTTVIDAAKRRQLPAWIREGLEKMEREKQKKIDRERQMKEREEYLQKKREEEENAMTELEKNTGQPVVPKKSKFESDSEESTHGESPTPSHSSLKRKSRFRNADSPNSSPQHQMTAIFQNADPEPPKSREEVMQEVMLKVRRTLTEILLEVTTEEMEAVAHEVLSKAKAKAPALQLRKTQALASLTGKLGLGMYGDSEDSDSGDDAAPEVSPSRLNGADSDEELRDQIQKRKIDFLKTEREIEARLREEEEWEKERERHMMGEESDESDKEERQVENQTDSKHLTQKGSEEEEEQEQKVKSLHSQDNMKHEDKLQNISGRDYFTSPISMRKSSREVELKSERSVENFKLEKKTKQFSRRSDTPPSHKQNDKSSASSEENDDDSSSKSNSDSSSTTDSSSSSQSSSSTSRRSSKKSSKTIRSMGSPRRQEKKNSNTSNRKRSSSRDSEHRKPDKKSNIQMDRKHEYDKDRKGKDRYRSPSSRSRSRSRTSRSRDGNERKLKDDRQHSSRRDMDTLFRKNHDSDRRNSSSSKPWAYRHERESFSPDDRKSKKGSRNKRRARHSSDSSSPSSSKHHSSHRTDKRRRYSRSRSSSSVPSKKSRHRRRSSSSSQSAQSIERERALGKKSGHSRND